MVGRTVRTVDMAMGVGDGITTRAVDGHGSVVQTSGEPLGCVQV